MIVGDRDAIVTLARYSLGDPALDEMYESALGRPYQSWMRRSQWCGLQVLYWYHLAGVAAGVHWVIGKSLPAALTLARPTYTPAPGDFGVFRKLEHHVLAAEISESSVKVVAGNTGPTPGVVAESVVKLHAAGLTWWSIEDYVRHA